jgi:hypothetical protein
VTEARVLIEKGIIYIEAAAVVAWLAKADDSLATQLRHEVDALVRAGIEEKEL